jgi:hypothetical protein
VANESSLIATASHKVHIAIPFLMFAPFGLIQWLVFGTDPSIVVMALACVTIPFLPLHVYGRDLYGVIGIIFSFRYVGIPLIAKTFYGQRLEENLFLPYDTYFMTTVLMVTETAILFAARAWDNGKTYFNFPLDSLSLQRLAVISCAIGFVGLVIAASNKSLESGIGNTGPVWLIANYMELLFLLGLAAQTLCGIIQSNGRSFVTFRLMLILVLELPLVVALNVREFYLTGLITVAATAFLYNTLRWRHLLFAALFGYFFLSIFSPITLYLRLMKEGLSMPQYLQLAQDTVVKAASDPSFFKDLTEAQKNSNFTDVKAWMPYDYYGDRSNVLNRLSFVALLDAVVNGGRTREAVGMDAVNEVIRRETPSFLVERDKSLATVGFGDWLSWQVGMSEPGRTYDANFGLPMEGYAAWHWAGFLGYPIVLTMLMLVLCARVSSFRLSIPGSIFMFATIQHDIIEATSDAFVSVITRSIPVTALALFVLYHFFFSARKSPKGLPTAAASSAE